MNKRVKKKNRPAAVMAALLCAAVILTGGCLAFAEVQARMAEALPQAGAAPFAFSAQGDTLTLELSGRAYRAEMPGLGAALQWASDALSGLERLVFQSPALP